MRQNETVGVVSSFCTCGSPLTVEDLLVPYSPAFRRKCVRNKSLQDKARLWSTASPPYQDIIKRKGTVRKDFRKPYSIC
jgi:hypothetical protein